MPEETSQSSEEWFCGCQEVCRKTCLWPSTGAASVPWLKCPMAISKSRNMSCWGCHLTVCTVLFYDITWYNIQYPRCVTNFRCLCQRKNILRTVLRRQEGWGNWGNHGKPHYIALLGRHNLDKGWTSCQAKMQISWKLAALAGWRFCRTKQMPASNKRSLGIPS